MIEFLFHLPLVLWLGEIDVHYKLLRRCVVGRVMHLASKAIIVHHRLEDVFLIWGDSLGCATNGHYPAKFPIFP